MNEWISVKDRMPEDLQWVIVVDGNRCVGEAIHVEHGEWFGHDESIEYIGVTHWMPLPEPPKEGCD